MTEGFGLAGALAVSQSGKALGYYTGTDGSWFFPELWNPATGTTQALYTNGNGEYRPLVDLNENGRIVGADRNRPCYIENRQAILLADGQGTAYKVNEGGVIVGVHKDKAVLWKPTGNSYTGTALDFLISSKTGWRLLTARSINEQGQIVGAGVYNGKIKAYLLTRIR